MAAILAIALPWLPSVAVTSTGRSLGATSSAMWAFRLATVILPRSRSYRSHNARQAAQDAPRILNAGSPSRCDSSFSRTCPAPSSAAKDGKEVSRVGSYPAKVW